MSGDRSDDIVERAYQVGASAIAAPPLAGLPDRRGTIRALGIVQIVLGAIFAAVALLLFIFAITNAHAGNSISTAFICAVPATNLLATGVASVKLEPWAPRGTVISASAWLGLIVLAAGAKLVIGGGLFGIGSGELALIAIVAVPVLLVVLALPIVLIAVYTRPSVRATFERRQLS